MSLFQLGNFVLSSGARSSWKLECDALTDDDVACLAEMVRLLVGPFSSVEGIPTGGLRLAKALESHRTRDTRGTCHLIVDDVLTTGGSMRRARLTCSNHLLPVAGAVIFARGFCPGWIRAVFQMPEALWLEPDTKGAPHA